MKEIDRFYLINFGYSHEDFVRFLKLKMKVLEKMEENQKKLYQPERLSEKNDPDLENPLSGKIKPLKFEHSSNEMNDQWVLDPDCMR